MPRVRSPNRDKAYKIWESSNGKVLLKDIANELGVSDTQIRKWKNQDKWEQNLKSNVTKKMKGNVTKPGAPKGNRNSVGHGAPKGNKNAVTTGAYETIWFDCLTEKEKILCETINTDTLAAVEEDLRLITIRERRMMEHIRQCMDGLTEKERKVLKELQIQKRPIEVYDDNTGQSKVVIVPESSMVVTEIRETEYRAIDDIIKLELALTGVQDKKARLLMNKHKIMYDNAILKLREEEAELNNF
jgi:uncharacterized protein YjcR